MIEFIIGAAAGVIIGYVVLRILLHIALSRAEKELELLAQAVEIYQASTISARVEQIDGVFYVYDTRDGSFQLSPTGQIVNHNGFNVLGVGAVPVARYWPIGSMPKAMVASSMLTSTLRPMPVRSRSNNAPSMPMQA